MQFDSPLIQAPLAGISCAPFRVLAAQYGSPGYCCTEMSSAKSLLTDSPRNKRYSYKDSREGPLCYQLSATDPIELALATKIATDSGADFIDLNCGCPVTKIRQKSAGSKHLENTDRLARLIAAMKESTHVPISIKIRVDGTSGDDNNITVAKTAEQAGADFLVVHGRHWRDDYTVACHYQQIRDIVSAVSMPVVGNGDVCDLASYQKMLATGCEAVMIGRAGVGQPWLYQQLLAEHQGKVFEAPTTKQIGAMFVEHINGLVSLVGERNALYQSRSLGKYYARQRISDLRYFSEVVGCNSLSELATVIEAYFT